MSIFSRPKTKGLKLPKAPSVSATPTEEEKLRQEQEIARKRRAGLARTLLTGGNVNDPLRKTKLGQ